MTRKRAKRVFLAFDSADEHLAGLIRGLLANWFGHGLEVTYSPQFAFGTRWREELGSAMQSGHLLLALCTAHSISNRWVHFEAGAFFGRGALVIPIVSGNLAREELPPPLNDFQGPRLDSVSDMVKLANQLAAHLEVKLCGNPAESANELRPLADLGVPEKIEAPFRSLLEVYNLKPWEKARQVLAASPSPFRLAIDDAIALFIAPGWSGLTRGQTPCSVGARRWFDPQVARAALAHQMTREDKDDNREKLALVRIDPLMTDRERLRLSFEQMRYFDYEGPRRALWTGDTPTEFASAFYLGKLIPEGIPTPLAAVQVVLVTADDYLALGIRRRAARSDFPEYDDRLGVTFEEQMRPGDGDVHGAVIRGLEEEAGIGDIEPARIQVLAVHYEASFTSVCPVAVARLRSTAAEVSYSVQFKAKDHEWDPVFVKDESNVLLGLLRLQDIPWEKLGAVHFLHEFSPQASYRWHGSSRFRLFAYLAMKDGIGRLLKGAE